MTYRRGHNFWDHILNSWFWDLWKLSFSYIGETWFLQRSFSSFRVLTLYQKKFYLRKGYWRIKKRKVWSWKLLKLCNITLNVSYIQVAVIKSFVQFTILLFLWQTQKLKNKSLLNREKMKFFSAWFSKKFVMLPVQ